MTASSGLLNPPFLFMYCLYFLLTVVWMSPESLPDTFLFLVVSNPANPMIFIISISSLDLPSKSFSVSMGAAGATAADFFFLLLPLPDALSLDLSLERSRDLSLDLLLSLTFSRSLLRSLESSLSLLRLLSRILSRDFDLLLDRLLLGDLDLLRLRPIVLAEANLKIFTPLILPTYWIKHN